jgi:HK97 family phage prohead protease
MTNYRTKDFTPSLGDELTFTGYLSTYGNADRDGDVIVEGAFDASVAERGTVPMLFNHDRNRVIGKLELSINTKGLFVKGTFNPDDPDAVKVYGLLKMGALDSMSVGMGVQDYTPIDPMRPFGGWNISKAAVYEGSVVTVPANAEALITEVKEQNGNSRGTIELTRARTLAQF